MEWNSDCMQLQLTCVTGAAWCKLNYLQCIFRTTPHRTSCMSKQDNVNHHASLSKHGTACCQLIIKCFNIVVLHSQTLVQKARVWLCKTTVMELSSWTKMRWQKLVLDLSWSLSVYLDPRSLLCLTTLVATFLTASSKHGPFGMVLQLVSRDKQALTMTS